MLVLSRKENQRIVFPNLGIAVEILRISGNSVKVGVDAPPQIRVLRSEVQDDGHSSAPETDSRSLRHALRNRLNTATLALHLMQRQMEAGLLDDAEQTLHATISDLSALDVLAGSLQPAGAADACPRCHRRALLVEDDANERELLAGLLRLSGYEVDVVEDGLAAIQYLAGHARPDCVLLDMQMPRMDGPQTVAAIRENPELSGIKVFAVTGLDPDLAQVPIGDRGVDRWFAKPLRPSEFVRDLDAEFSPHATVV
ncbi:MAG: response regulator [Planctomyces sp.]|nr:response regulator [Planctomyces sp.]